MKARILFRQIHHWGSIIIALPLIIMIGAGILLMLKKDIDWLQPPTQKGVSVDAVPMASLNELFEAAKTVREAGFTTWAALDRADLKPGKGVIKFVSDTRWEVQVDTHSAEVLQVAYRRSDLIESLHDGSWFSDWTKLGLFLPAGILLFILWLTGLYLFALPHWTKWKKKKAKPGIKTKP